MRLSGYSSESLPFDPVNREEFMLPKPIKPVGDHPDFIWSELLNPNDVKPSRLPPKAGVYVAVACDSQGDPIKQPSEPDHSPLPGVVYIGMTGSSYTLQNRFSELARAWRPDSNQATPSHDSRKHYNDDPMAQQAFTVANVRLRFMPLPTFAKQEPVELENLAKSQDLSVNELRSLLSLEKTAEKRVEAMEAGLIQWFKRAYGYIPILNRDDDGTKDERPTEDWIDQHFTDMERRGI